MKAIILTALVCAALAYPIEQAPYEAPQSNDLWTYMGTFTMNAPAFVEIITFDDDDTKEKHLLISEFSAIPFVSGNVYLASGVKESMLNGEIDKIAPQKIGSGFKWPNMVDTIPFKVFNSRAILVPDGFLVPTKKNGGLYVITLDQSNQPQQQFKISQDKTDYFYHTGYWKDFNGDGHLDLLTARTDAVKGDGELLWL